MITQNLEILEKWKDQMIMQNLEILESSFQLKWCCTNKKSGRAVYKVTPESARKTLQETEMRRLNENPAFSIFESGYNPVSHLLYSSFEHPPPSLQPRKKKKKKCYYFLLYHVLRNIHFSRP